MPLAGQPGGGPAHSRLGEPRERSADWRTEGTAEQNAATGEARWQPAGYLNQQREPTGLAILSKPINLKSNTRVVMPQPSRQTSRGAQS
jgi:hypothetical protein